MRRRGSDRAARCLREAGGERTVRGHARGGPDPEHPDTLDPSTEQTFGSVEVLRAICERLYDFDARATCSPSSRARCRRSRPTSSRTRSRFAGASCSTTAPRSTPRRSSSRSSGAASRLHPGQRPGPIQSVDRRRAVHGRDPPQLPVQAAAPDACDERRDRDLPGAAAEARGELRHRPDLRRPVHVRPPVAGVSVTVIKSPYYYDKYAVHHDKIVFQAGADSAAAMAALRPATSSAGQLAPSCLPRLPGDSSVHLSRSTALGWNGLDQLGNKNGLGNLPYSGVTTPLASSPLLRQAFEEASTGTPRQGRVQRGSGSRLHADLAREPRSTTRHQMHALRPGRTRSAGREVGHPEPDRAPPSTSRRCPRQFIQAEEAAVGINVVFDHGTTATRCRTSSAATSTPIDTVFTATRPSTGTSSSSSPRRDRNFGGYSNPRLDLILANARKAWSPKALKTLWHAPCRSCSRIARSSFSGTGSSTRPSHRREGRGVPLGHPARVNFAQYG